MPLAPELDDLRGLAAKAARDGLGRMGARLDCARIEDLVSDLMVVGLIAQRRHDGSRGPGKLT